MISSISNTARLWLLIVTLTNGSLLAIARPSWYFLVFFAGILWRLLILFQALKIPSNRLRYLIFLFFLFTVILTSKYPFTKDTSVGVFLAFVLQILLGQLTHTGMLLGSFNALFLLAASITPLKEKLPPVFFAVISLLPMLGIYLTYFPSNAKHSAIELVKNVLKIAFPVSIILLVIYYFYPQIHPREADIGYDFGADLNPGDIASLSASERTAFRANFSVKNSLLPSEWYWRADVLDSSFGMHWKKTINKQIKENNITTKVNSDTQSEIVQQIYADSHLSYALPALDIPVRIETLTNKKSTVMSDLLNSTFFRTEMSTLGLFSYKAYSNKKDYKMDLSSDDLKNYLKVDALISDRLKNLLLTFDSEPNEYSKAQSLLQYFKNGGFSYSREPGVLSTKDKLDEFLFEKKSGFCEHYAASFASLMRLLKVPSRIVVGFQGGDSNKNSLSVIVRDSNAHAWVEIWIKNKKTWLRIDPTGVVAPYRMQKKANQENFLTALKIVISELFESAVFKLELIILEIQFFGAFFMKNWLITIVCCGLIAFLVKILITAAKRLKHRDDYDFRLEKALKILENILRSHGIVRNKGEAVGSFLRRANVILQMLVKEELLLFTEKYQNLRYGKKQPDLKNNLIILENINKKIKSKLKLVASTSRNLIDK